MAGPRTSCQAKQLTASGVVTTAGKRGKLCGYVIKVGTTDTLLTFKDGGTGGTVLWEDGWNGETAAGEVFRSHNFSTPIEFNTDIYVTLAGTAAKVCVSYVQYERVV